MKISKYWLVLKKCMISGRHFIQLTDCSKVYDIMSGYRLEISKATVTLGALVQCLLSHPVCSWNSFIEEDIVNFFSHFTPF